MARFYGEIRGNRGGASRMGSKESGINGHLRGWDIGGEVSMRDAAGIDVVDLEVTAGSNGDGRRLHVATFTRNGTGYAIQGGLVEDLLAALESCAEWIDENAAPSDTGEGQQADAVLSAARAAIAKARGA